MRQKIVGTTYPKSSLIFLERPSSNFYTDLGGGGYPHFFAKKYDLGLDEVNILSLTLIIYWFQLTLKILAKSELVEFFADFGIFTPPLFLQKK